MDMTLYPKNCGVIGGIVPVDFETDEGGKEYAWEGARLAIEEHNAKHGVRFVFL